MISTGTLGATRYMVRRLTIADIAQIEAVQKDVVAALEDKAILQPLDRGELENIVGGNGVMLGAFVGEQLIAFRALLDPLDDDEHLGRDGGLTEAQLSKVIYQEVSNVHPSYRGYGLQKTLASLIMNEVDTSRYHYVCATVMPFNIASLKDKFAQGLKIVALKLKYGGKLRYVFMKDLIGEKIQYTVAVEVAMSDTEKQQQLLCDGYVGTSMRLADEWVVRYEK